MTFEDAEQPALLPDEDHESGAVEDGQDEIERLAMLARSGVLDVRSDDTNGSPLPGDEFYPLFIAEAGNKGHITEDEFSELYAHHKLVERAREARTA